MFISFLFDQTGCFLAGGRALMKPQEMTNADGRMMESLREIFFKKGRTHFSMFDVRCSTFISFFLDLTGGFPSQRLG